MDEKIKQIKALISQWMNDKTKSQTNVVFNEGAVQAGNIILGILSSNESNSSEQKTEKDPGQQPAGEPGGTTGTDKRPRRRRGNGSETAG